MSAHKAIAVLAASLILPPAWGALDGRLHTAVYSADEVYRLHGQSGFQIDLQFEAGETFVGLGAGDLAGLAYFAEGNHLFLKPRAAQVVTNITVLTNRRQYQFDYSTVSHAEGPMYALRFSYPLVAPAAAAASALASRIDTSLTAASSERPHNVDYWYCGAGSLQPLSVWDDGVRTVLRFASRAEQPAIFVRNDDGVESLLNFSMSGDEVMVQRVARRLILRRGALSACIVNRGYVGTGARLDSGTVSQGVQRSLTGGAR